MDTNVKRIRPKDYELSTVQENLGNAVDQLLAAYNTTVPPQQIVLSPKLQQTRGPGTPYSIQKPALTVIGDPQQLDTPSVVLGSPATQVQKQQNANTQIYGNLLLTTMGQRGFIVVPGATGPAVIITNVAGQPVITMGESGTLDLVNTATAPSFVSAAGFKSFIPMGLISRAANQNTPMRTVEMAQQQIALGSTGSFVVNQPMPHAGSIVGISIQLDRTITLPVAVQVYRNALQATTGAYIDLPAVPAGSFVPPAPMVYPKGRYPFNAGDSLGMGCSSGGATYAVKMGITVEFGA